MPGPKSRSPDQPAQAKPGISVKETTSYCLSHQLEKGIEDLTGMVIPFSPLPFGALPADSVSRRRRPEVLPFKPCG